MSTKEYSEIVLTFPSDGRLVGPGELTQWLQEIEADPDLTEAEKDLAYSIVHQVQALSN